MNGGPAVASARESRPAERSLLVIDRGGSDSAARIREAYRILLRSVAQGGNLNRTHGETSAGIQSAALRELDGPEGRP